MRDDELIELLRGPSGVRDEFTAIHIQARDARLAADRIAALAEQVKRARHVLADAIEAAVLEHKRTFPAPEYKAANIALGGLRSVGFVIAPETFRIGNEEAIRALRSATEGAGEP